MRSNMVRLCTAPWVQGGKIVLLGLEKTTICFESSTSVLSETYYFMSFQLVRVVYTSYIAHQNGNTYTAMLVLDFPYTRSSINEFSHKREPLSHCVA
jgi:hypothetical protein